MKVLCNLHPTSRFGLRITTGALLASYKYHVPKQAYHFRSNYTMAGRDVSSQSNIHVMKTEADGSFKRKASTFRHFIQKDGQFTPEKGLVFRLHRSRVGAA